MKLSVDRVSIPYFESIRPDGTTFFKLKTKLERFQQYTEQVNEIHIESKITGKEMKEQNFLGNKKQKKKISNGHWVHKWTKTAKTTSKSVETTKKDIPKEETILGNSKYCSVDDFQYQASMPLRLTNANFSVARKCVSQACLNNITL